MRWLIFEWETQSLLFSRSSSSYAFIFDEKGHDFAIYDASLETAIEISRDRVTEFSFNADVKDAFGLSSELWKRLLQDGGRLECGSTSAKRIDGTNRYIVVDDGKLFSSERASQTLEFKQITTVSSGITAFDQVAVGGEMFIVALNATGNEMTVLQLQDDGGWRPVDAVSQQQSWQVDIPNQVQTVLIDGSCFVVVGASGTSSLSVFQLTQNGSLIAVDHIYETLDTRFQNVMDFDIAQVGGRTFVVVAGADSGITLFDMLPSGQLVLIEVIKDTIEMPLGGVEKVIFQQDDEKLFVLTLAQNNDGLGRFQVDVTTLDKQLISGAWHDKLAGGDGDDLIVDGRGSDTLSGGVGEDHFIFLQDGNLIRSLVLNLKKMCWIYLFGSVAILRSSFHISNKKKVLS